LVAIVKKLLTWLLAGATFGVGFVVAGYLVLKLLFPAPSDQEIMRDILSEEEQKLELSCNEARSRALTVIDEAVAPIILAERRGEDWSAHSSEGLLIRLKENERATFKCHLINSAAAEAGLDKKGNYEEMYKLFSLLHTYLTPYDEEGPDSSKFSPEVFSEINALYSTLTTGSSGDAQNMRAP